MMRRTIETNYTEEDSRIEGSLRPKRLSEYIGQTKIKDSLGISIEAARQRKEPLDHLLFYGPPGLGKTTISGIIANEMGVNMRVTSGPAVEKPGEMAAILNGLKENDILFVDEIHRLNKQVEEVLYPAMEDFAIDIMIGKGPTAKSIRLELPHFTLIGATTRAGLLSAPLRDRFGEIHRLEFYNTDELRQIVMASAKKLRVPIDEEGAVELARRSRGTPRLANRILKRVRDYAQVRYDDRRGPRHAGGPCGAVSSAERTDQSDAEREGRDAGGIQPSRDPLRRAGVKKMLAQGGSHLWKPRGARLLHALVCARCAGMTTRVIGGIRTWLTRQMRR